MHPSDFHDMPNSAQLQYLDREVAKAIDRWLDRVLTVVEVFSPSLRKQRQEARSAMQKELEQYEDYLCSMSQDFDDDFPW